MARGERRRERKGMEVGGGERLCRECTVRCVIVVSNRSCNGSSLGLSVLSVTGHSSECAPRLPGVSDNTNLRRILGCNQVGASCEVFSLGLGGNSYALGVLDFASHI